MMKNLQLLALHWSQHKQIDITTGALLNYSTIGRLKHLEYLEIGPNLAASSAGVVLSYNQLKQLLCNHPPIKHLDLAFTEYFTDDDHLQHR